VIAQFGAADVRCDADGGATARYALDELLPRRFGLEP
jgi:hypothetical protein